MSENIARELGAINAKLDHIKESQEKQGATTSKIEERLRKVETKSAINAGVVASVMALSVSFIKDKFLS